MVHVCRGVRHHGVHFKAFDGVFKRNTCIHNIKMFTRGIFSFHMDSDVIFELVL
jgi:hypothetical protein